MQAPYRLIEQIGGKLKLPPSLVAQAESDNEPAEERLERRIALLAREIDAAPPLQRFFRH